jgi:hypothetical protein
VHQLGKTVLRFGWMRTGWEKTVLWFWMDEHWLGKTVLGFGWMSTDWLGKLWMSTGWVV